MSQPTNLDEESVKTLTYSDDQGQQADLPVGDRAEHNVPSREHLTTHSLSAPKHGEGNVDPSVLNQGKQAGLIDLAHMLQSRGGRARAIVIDRSGNGCDHEPDLCDDPKCRTIARIKLLEEQLAQAIAEKNQAIAEKNQAVADARAAHKALVDGLNKTIEDLRAEKKEQEAKLKSMEDHIAQQDQHIAQQDQHIAKLQDDNVALQDQLATHEAVIANLEARLDGANQNADQERGGRFRAEVQRRQAVARRAEADAQRAEVDQRYQELQQRLLQRQIITVFRDTVCVCDVVNRMPVNVRARINVDTRGDELVGPANYRQSRLDSWLLSCINQGNGDAHPLYNYQTGLFKCTRATMLQAVRRSARGDELAWLEHIVGEMAEFFDHVDDLAALEYLQTL